MERHFEKELEHLNARIIAMGNDALEMIRLATQMLVDRQPELAERVFAIETGMDRMQVEIDEFVLRLMATQQPVAADLRFLVVGMKINSELERIADQAVNIAETAQFYLQSPPLKPLIDLPLMAQSAQQMVRESLESFFKRDPIEAKGVIMEDDRVDALKDQIFRELLTYMMSDPSTIPQALSLILISRNLERIGDQATNIAEEVIYMVEGRDVRHPETTPSGPTSP